MKILRRLGFNDILFFSTFCYNFFDMYDNIWCVKNKVLEETHRFDVDMVIVSINADCSLSDDKYQNPRLCNTILFETVEEPHLYREINTCKMGHTRFHIDVPWLYNHLPGDTVHFDYLLKKKFFKIEKR